MVQTSVHACARVTAFFELFLGLQSACAAQLAFVYELVLGAMRASEDGNGQRCERSARSSLPLPRSFPAAGRRLRRRVFFFLYRHRASGQRPRRELSKSFRLPSAPSFPLPDPSRPPAGACGAGVFLSLLPPPVKNRRKTRACMTPTTPDCFSTSHLTPLYIEGSWRRRRSPPPYRRRRHLQACRPQDLGRDRAALRTVRRRGD